jgi:hypothetical protein
MGSVADPGCLPRIRHFSIPDPNFFHPGSRIHTKEFKYFNPKNCFLISRNYDLVCSSWIPDPDPDFFTHPGSRIPDPGVKRQRIPVRNTGSGALGAPYHYTTWLRERGGGAALRYSYLGWDLLAQPCGGHAPVGAAGGRPVLHHHTADMNTVRVHLQQQRQKCHPAPDIVARGSESIANAVDAVFQNPSSRCPSVRFSTHFFTPINPAWVDVMKIEEKQFLKTTADIRHFVFFANAECALKKLSTHAEHALKNFLRMLRMR